MLLSKRLKKAYDLVLKGARIVDLGCDHGYLGITLVKNDIASYAYLVDVNKSPLEEAKKNVIKYEVSDKCECILSDGLKNVNGTFDHILILGMGGLAIIDILKAYNLIVETLILSPHKDVYELRKYLEEINYEITYETFIIDKNKHYFIIKAIPGESKSNEIEFLFGKYNLTHENEEFYDYLKKKISYYENCLNNSPHAKTLKEKLDQFYEAKNEYERYN